MSGIIQPVLIGYGRAGRAMLKALELIRIEHSGVDVADPVILPRDLRLASSRVRELSSSARVLAMIANPHALHAPTLRAMIDAGAANAFVEKPVVVNPSQISLLRDVQIPVAVAHGYRVQWGIRKMRELIAGAQIFSIEGKYWQSSAASSRGAPSPKAWVQDPALSGEYDVLLDLGTHYLDLCAHLMGSVEWKGDAFCSYVNASADHRETHVMFSLGTPTGARVSGSVSKAVHGAGNELELHVLTDRNAVSWSFADPDRVIVGEGSSRRVISRTDRFSGSGLAPFHAAGWLDGYCEILAGLMGISGTGSYPTLTEHLDVVESLFTRVNLIRA